MICKKEMETFAKAYIDSSRWDKKVFADIDFHFLTLDPGSVVNMRFAMELSLVIQL